MTIKPLFKDRISTQKNAHYLCLDIGGSKIASGIFQSSSSPSLHDLILWHYSESQKGKTTLLRAIEKNLEHLLLQAKKTNISLAPVISIGTPGKLIGENNTVLAPGSANNLGIKPGEFDHCNIQDYLGEILPPNIRYIIHNDGVTQCAGGVQHLLKKNITLVNHVVGYIGPGTGLGGGFCYLDDQNKFDFFSDGHIFDIMLQNIADPQKEVMAEDVISGRGFFDQNRISTKEVNNTPALLEKYDQDIKDMGTYLGQLCDLLHQGSFEKKVKSNNWSEEDLKKVKGLSHILIGGSLGTKGRFSDILLNSAQRYLTEQCLVKLKLHPLDQIEKRALLGAFLLIG